MSDDWFVRKTFGFGATPVTWQGYALTIGYVALLAADLARMPAPLPRWIVATVLTIAFAGLAAHKTRGGLGWRWGGSDDR